MNEVASKWGKLVAARGFTQVPNYLLLVNMFVHDDHKLSPTETMVLLQLVASWWKKDEMPFPSMNTISDRSGISGRQVQRALNSLETKGYLKKSKKKIKGVIATNIYDLTPLVGVLNTIAEHYGNKFPRKVKGDALPNEEAGQQPQPSSPTPSGAPPRRRKRALNLDKD